jgi:hypothetical protein
LGAVLVLRLGLHGLRHFLNELTSRGREPVAKSSFAAAVV